MSNGGVVADKLWDEYGENLKGYSGPYVVEVVRFTN